MSATLVPCCCSLPNVCVEKKYFAHQNSLFSYRRANVVENMIILDKCDVFSSRNFFFHALRLFFLLTVSKVLQTMRLNFIFMTHFLLSYRFPRLELQRVFQRKITQRLRLHFSQQLVSQWVDSRWNKWQNHQENFKLMIMNVVLKVECFFHPEFLTDWFSQLTNIIFKLCKREVISNDSNNSYLRLD